MPGERQFRIDPTDVLCDWHGSNTGLRSQRNRQSRAMDITSSTVTLTHAPTGVSVQGTVPRGHYSNRQMRALVEKLRISLLEQLELAVARKLRLPGL